MTIRKIEINELWKKAKKGIYYDNEELKKNKGKTNKLKKYNYKRKEIKDNV